MRATHTDSNMPGRPTGERATALPDAMAERLAGRLGEALSEALRQIADELFTRSGCMPDPELRALHLAALRFARDRQKTFSSAFATHFRQGLRLARVKTREDRPKSLDFDTTDLHLLDKGDWHRHQAVANLAEHIRSTCADELYGLASRIEPDCVFDLSASPVGPEAIALAVMDAYDEQGVSPKMGQILFALLERHLPARIDAACRALGHQVVPQVRSAADMATAGNEPLLELSVSLPDIRERTAREPPPVQAVDETAILSRLSALQDDQLAALAEEGALVKVGEQASQPADLPTLLEECGLARSMGHRAGMIADMIGMLFDYIQRDPALPEAMKALLRRLQVPILIVALQDNTFFRKAAHPARRLLNDLAQAALDCAGSEGLQPLALDLVRAVLAQSDHREDGFAQACTRLQGFMAEEKRRLAAAVRQREQSEIAVAAARDEVRRHLEAGPLPETMRSFLTRRWCPYLAMTHAETGPDSRDWLQAIRTMDDLIWSLAPKTGRGDRERLVATLPGLLKALDAGLRHSDTPQAERDRFFAALVKCHAQAMQVAAVPKPHERGSISGPEARQAEPPAEAADGDLGSTAPRPALPARLVRGAWIEYPADDGRRLLAKLAWISPHGALCLFTDPQGERVLPIKAARLANGLSEGTIRILDTAPLTDRAVKDILQRVLHKAA